MLLIVLLVKLKYYIDITFHFQSDSTKASFKRQVELPNKVKSCLNLSWKITKEIRSYHKTASLANCDTFIQYLARQTPAEYNTYTRDFDANETQTRHQVIELKTCFKRVPGY